MRVLASNPDLPARGIPRLALALLVLIKLGLLVTIGPVHAPDSAEYLNFGRAILAGNVSLREIDFARHMAPVTMFRMAGYPAIVAGALAVSNDAWAWLICALQIGVAVCVSVYFYVVARAVAGDWRLALLLTVAQASALNGAIDQFILTDSLYVSLCTLATLALVEIAILAKPPAGRLFAAAAALTGAFLIREAHLMLCLLWAPLAFVALVQRQAIIRALLGTAIMLAPILLTSHVYQSWNLHRSGTRMLTTVYQVVLLHPLVRAQRHDPQIFGGDTDIERTARATIKNYDYADTVAINQTLHRDHGWRAPELARDMQRRYWQAWRQHPYAMLRAAADRIGFDHLLLIVQPLATVNYLLSQSSPELRNAVSFSTLKTRVFKSGQIQYLPLLLFDIAAKMASLVLLAMAIRTATVACTGLRLPSLALMMLPAGYYAAHIAVHFDDRYMMPVIPAVLLGAAIGWRDVATKRQSRPARPRAGVE